MITVSLLTLLRERDETIQRVCAGTNTARNERGLFLFRKCYPGPFRYFASSTALFVTRFDAAEKRVSLDAFKALSQKVSSALKSVSPTTGDM